MKKIRVAQFGTWMYTHAEHTMLAMRNMPQCYDVVGICEPDEDRWKLAEKRACYFGLRRMSVDEVLADKSLDAVIVETDEMTSDGVALMFAENGFNIHVDKPCGASPKIFEKLIATVKRKNLKFQVGYMYRFNPAVVRALELVQSGKLGQIICVEAQMSQCYHGDMLRWLGDLPDGMMFYLGCHLVDLMYMFMGEPDEIVPMNTATKLEYSNVRDYGLTLLRYPHGISFIKSVACEISGDMRRQLVISGTNGTIEIKPIENPMEISSLICANKISCKVTYPTKSCSFDDRSEIISFPPFGRYDAMLKDFAEIVANEKSNQFSPEYELNVHRMLMKACEVNNTERLK